MIEETSAAFGPVDASRQHPVAFVLGGGGVLGAAEVGMARALAEAGIRPDVVLGTSIGALNGCFVAADPSPAAAERLADLWRGVGGGPDFAAPVPRPPGAPSPP